MSGLTVALARALKYFDGSALQRKLQQDDSFTSFVKLYRMGPGNSLDAVSRYVKRRFLHVYLGLLMATFVDSQDVQSLLHPAVMC